MREVLLWSRTRIQNKQFIDSLFLLSSISLPYSKEYNIFFCKGYVLCQSPPPLKELISGYFHQLYSMKSKTHNFLCIWTNADNYRYYNQPAVYNKLYFYFTQLFPYPFLLTFPFLSWSMKTRGSGNAKIEILEWKLTYCNLMQGYRNWQKQRL